MIYPNRATEQRDIQPYSSLLNSSQVHRIYLNELGDIQTLPLEVALTILTTLDDPAVPNQARILVERCQQSPIPVSQQRAIIEMVTTILVYTFTHLSRQEVNAMLGITEVTLKDTRFYQEVREEGVQQGVQQGLQQGLQQGERSLLQRLLTARFGPLSESVTAAIASLNSAQIESLSLALFDFTELADVEAWLAPELGRTLIRKLTERFGDLPEGMVAELQGESSGEPARLLARWVALLEGLDGLETLEVVQGWLDNHPVEVAELEE